MDKTRVTYVGINICKEKLDVYIASPLKIAQLENSPSRVKYFVLTLREISNPFVLFKAAEGYELDLLDALIQNQIPFRRLQLQQIRDFMESQNLATDVIGAKALVLFGMSQDGAASPKLSSEKVKDLHDAMEFRRLLSDMIAKTEAMDVTEADARKRRNETLDMFQSHVVMLEKDITQLLEENSESTPETNPETAEQAPVRVLSVPPRVPADEGELPPNFPFSRNPSARRSPLRSLRSLRQIH